jgi:hypothetical protein
LNKAKGRRNVDTCAFFFSDRVALSLPTTRNDVTRRHSTSLTEKKPTRVPYTMTTTTSMMHERVTVTQMRAFPVAPQSGRFGSRRRLGAFTWVRRGRGGVSGAPGCAFPQPVADDDARRHRELEEEGGRVRRGW